MSEEFSKEFSKACQAFLDAEHKRDAIKQYILGLPSDEKYDLGLSLSIHWSSQSDGHRFIQQGIRKLVAQDLRAHCHALLEEAENDVTTSRDALQRMVQQ